jgi:hypothetical protein
VIEVIGGGSDKLVRKLGEVAVAWSKVTHQAVAVLVGTTLPRAVGIGKEGVAIEFALNLLKGGKFRAIVEGQGLDRQMGQRTDDGVADSIGTAVIDMAHDQVTALALNQSDQTRFRTATAQNRVCLPVAEAVTQLNLLGAFSNPGAVSWQRSAPLAAPAHFVPAQAAQMFG